MGGATGAMLCWLGPPNGAKPEKGSLEADGKNGAGWAAAAGCGAAGEGWGAGELRRLSCSNCAPRPATDCAPKAGAGAIAGAGAAGEGAAAPPLPDWKSSKSAKPSSCAAIGLPPIAGAAWACGAASGGAASGAAMAGCCCCCWRRDCVEEDGGGARRPMKPAPEVSVFSWDRRVRPSMPLRLMVIFWPSLRDRSFAGSCDFGSSTSFSRSTHVLLKSLRVQLKSKASLRSSNPRPMKACRAPFVIFSTK
mmetsp:Transcript_85809/g.267044  ORF Transcript_85809/g.267044 Transcript_85809/m.267044 type:complete len:250 (-) Transcript_85809:355-1104(-)